MIGMKRIGDSALGTNVPVETLIDELMQLPSEAQVYIGLTMGFAELRVYDQSGEVIAILMSQTNLN